MSQLIVDNVFNHPSQYNLAAALGPLTTYSGYGPMLGFKHPRTVCETQHEEERRLNASKLIQRVWRGHHARRELANARTLPVETTYKPSVHEASFDDGEFFDYGVFNDDLTGDFEFLFSEPSAVIGSNFQVTESSFPSDAPSLSDCTTQARRGYSSATDIQSTQRSFLPDNEQQTIAPTEGSQHSAPVLESHTSTNLDMNDPAVLQLYTQLIIFQQDVTRSSMVFENPDPPTQDLLYALARKIGLEFKHTLHPAQVTLSRQLSAVSLNFDVSCYDSGISNYCMGDGSVSGPSTEQSQFSPGFHPNPPATPPDESMVAQDEIDQSDSNSKTIFEGLNTHQSQKQFRANSFLNLAESPGPYQHDHGRGEPQYATFGLPTLRQRTAIACRYCRRRKIRCAGYDQDLKIQCTNCQRFQQECVFTPTPMPTLPNPAFVLPHMDFPNLQKNSIDGSGKSTSAGGDETTTRNMQRPLPVPITTDSVPSCIPQEPANVSSGPQAHISHEFVLDLNFGGGNGKRNSLGRQGPLNESSRANSKAVKAIGACWKCKVLRKKCNDTETCYNCAKGQEYSLFKDIGCRRGPLENQMPKAVFCPKYRSDGEYILYTPRKSFICETLLQDLKKEGLGEGFQASPSLLENVGHEVGKERLADLRRLVLESRFALFRRRAVSEVSFERSGRSILHGRALFECLSSFAIQRFPGSSGVGPQKSVSSTDLEYESIIRRSLECLLYGLKAMHISSEESSPSTHEACTAKKCGVSPAEILQICLAQYINELSQQIFRKKNLRGDNSWWLPSFCSLVIQGFAIRTIKASSTAEEELASKYLHPAVQLFIAMSPKDVNKPDKQFGRILQYFGFESPAECLLDIFGMLDQPAKSLRASNELTTPIAAAIRLEIAEEVAKYDQANSLAAFADRHITRTNIDTTKGQSEDTQMIDHHDSAENDHVS